MPRMNGIEATREIKRHFPDIFILALTAYDDFAYVSRLIENGASGYILKSVRSEELIQAIRATALGECILHPDIAREVFARIARRSGLLAEHQGEVSGDQSFRSEAACLTEVWSIQAREATGCLQPGGSHPQTCSQRAFKQRDRF